MRTGSLASAFYAPAPVPADVKNLPLYLQEEFSKISAAVTALANGHLDISTVAPAKPRAGDIRYADGTIWNPGSGAGIYRYTAGGAWVFVG